MVGGYKNRFIVAGGFVSARDVLRRVPGFSSLAVLHLRVIYSFVWYAGSAGLPSVVDGNERRVNVGGGIVSACAVCLGVPGCSSLVVPHLWAHVSYVLFLYHILDLKHKYYLHL